MRIAVGIGLALALILPLPVAWAEEEPPIETEGAQHQASPITQTGVTATTAGTMNLRAAPGTGAVIGWVPGGKTVPVLGRDINGRWLFVEYAPMRGWLAGWLVTLSGDITAVPVTDEIGALIGGATPAPVPTPLPGSVIAIARTTMNIRQGPGASYKVLGRLPSGTAIPVLGRNAAKSWLLIEYSGIRGWVSRSLCKITGDIAVIPVVPANAASAPPTPPPPLPGQPTGSYTVHLAGVGSHLLETYRRGQQLGNRSNAFSKIGDCELATPGFLQPIDSNHYNLGQYMYLQDTVEFFAATRSFGHVGQASSNGFTSSNVLNPTWANPSICQPGETPLACEYRTHRPAIALVTIRTDYYGVGPDHKYYNELRAIVQYSLSQGVIPVLGTMPIWGPSHPPAETLNDVVRTVAREFNVPLWDFWVTAEALPGRGVDASFHLSSPDWWWAVHLTPDLLSYGMVRYNLEALEVLDALMHQVVQP